MAKVNNPNERVLGSNNLIVTSSIEEPAAYSFTLRCVKGLSNINRLQQSIYDITADPNKTTPIGILESGISVPAEITVQVPIGHQLSISGLRSGNPMTNGWGVAGPVLTNCVSEESGSGYLPYEITVNIQDSPASMEISWQYGPLSSGGVEIG